MVMAILVENPFVPILDLEGVGEDGGEVYIGVANQNPETNPQTVYWDEALTIPASQPLQTIAGYIYRNGAPARPYVANPYSITALSAQGVQIFTLPELGTVPTTTTDVFDTLDDLEAATVDPSVQVVTINRYSTSTPYAPFKMERLPTNVGTVFAWQRRSNGDTVRWQLIIEDKINALWIGAVADGVALDTAAVQSALDYAKARGGGVAYCPTATYNMTKLDLYYQCAIEGDGPTSTIFMYNSATDGIAIDEVFNLGQRIEKLCLRTNHLDCGKAIDIPTKAAGSVNIVVRDVLINSEDPDTRRWDYGIWAENCQNSQFENIQIYYCTKVGIRTQYGNNANNWIGVEVIGLTADSERAVEMDADSPSGGSLVYEDQWFGCTFQGAFSKSAFWAHSCSPKMQGIHIENTDATPSDGADVVFTGGIVNASIVGCEGGSISVSGTVKNLTLVGSQFNDVSVGANCEATLAGCRYGTLTEDAAAFVTTIGCTTTGGAGRPNPIWNAVPYYDPVPTISDNSATPTITDTTVVIFNNGSATNVTSILGGREGQVLDCLVQPNTTLVDGGNLRIAGNLVGAFNYMISLRKIAGDWYETSRSAN